MEAVLDEVLRLRISMPLPVVLAVELTKLLAPVSKVESVPKEACPTCCGRESRRLTECPKANLEQA